MEKKRTPNAAKRRIVQKWQCINKKTATVSHTAAVNVESTNTTSGEVYPFMVAQLPRYCKEIYHEV